MSDQYIGEIRMFGGNFAISQWALCNGQTMAITQNQALFAIIGTTFGGNGVNTFNLPDLRGRLPVGQGQGPALSNRVMGESAGTETVALLTQNLPTHNHSLNASSSNATANTIANNLLPGKIVTPSTGHFYTVNVGSPPPTLGNLNPQSAGMSGGNLPHNNLMPALCVTFIIALYGIFPSRN